MASVAAAANPAIPGFDASAMRMPHGSAAEWVKSALPRERCPREIVRPAQTSAKPALRRSLPAWH